MHSRRRMECVGRRTNWILPAALLGVAFGQGRAPAAVLDGFETPQVSWQAGESDVSYRVDSHRRIVGDAHGGQGSEQLQITGTGGTHVYFTHDIGTARIVAELTPSVWIKANRPGIQILARVVLPHAADPRTGQPVTTLIRGESYSSVGSWQQIRLTDTPQLVSRQVRVLRAQMGPQVDAREAFIDQVLLNVYGGPGQTTLNIDDLDLAGVVPRENSKPMVGAIQPASANGPSSVSNPAAGAPGDANLQSDSHQVLLSGSVLLVDGKPFYPRMIQSQGEPLAWLKQQGFNVVRCNGQINNEMLAEAKQLGLWLIGPPPVRGQTAEGAISLAEVTSAYDPVLAWHLGDGLANREIVPTAAVGKQLRQADRQLRRPIVCSAEEDLLPYSRLADLLSSYRFPLETTLQLKDYGEWVRNRPRLARPGTPLWTVVQTEPAPAVVEQTSVLSGKQATEPFVDPDSLRLLAYQAFCCGARGIEFASTSRLDASDFSTRLRAVSLALLNLELELIEPWGAAGNYVTTATSNDPAITGIVLQTDSARLVVAMRCQKDSQYIAAPQVGGTSLPPITGSVPPKLKDKPAPISDTPTKKSDGSGDLHSSKTLARTTGGATRADSLGARQAQDNAIAGATPAQTKGPAPGTASLVVPGVPDGHSVWELTPAGLRPLRAERIAGGTVIAIEDFALTALLVITPDAVVERKMSQRAAMLAPRAAQLQRELAVLMLSETEAVDRRLVGQTQLPPAAMSLAAARADIARADQLLAAGNYANAYYAARNATWPIARWKREVWERTVKPLASPASSPLAVSFNSLPDHLAFMYSILKMPTSDNLLPGSDFENLQTMLQSGWRHFEHAQNEVQTSVELSPLAPYAGRMSLKMQVRAADPNTAPTIVESPPLWIKSAPVHLNTGDVVCIRGQVRVPSPLNGSVDGLMIIDSLGGEALAERIDQTSGWHEFVLYRAAPYTGDLTLTFALTGLGEAWIDDVSVRIVRRATMGAAPTSDGFSSAGNFVSGMPLNR